MSETWSSMFSKSGRQKQRRTARRTKPARGCHIQVRDKSSAVLESEIERLVAPGTRIISDALRSYRLLPDHGYEHDYVVHDREFLSSTDTSVHTQNIEIRNVGRRLLSKVIRKTVHCTHTWRNTATGECCYAESKLQ